VKESAIQADLHFELGERHCATPFGDHQAGSASGARRLTPPLHTLVRFGIVLLSGFVGVAPLLAGGADR